jgi:hypothetical protein
LLAVFAGGARSVLGALDALISWLPAAAFAFPAAVRLGSAVVAAFDKPGRSIVPVAFMLVASARAAAVL